MQRNSHFLHLAQCSLGMSQSSWQTGCEVGGGGAGGGEEDPSRLRVEKEGISGLPKDMTRRLPEVGDGERRCSGRRGGAGGSRGGGSTSARVAWLAAARWLNSILHF